MLKTTRSVSSITHPRADGTKIAPLSHDGTERSGWEWWRCVYIDAEEPDNSWAGSPGNNTKGCNNHTCPPTLHSNLRYRRGRRLGDADVVVSVVAARGMCKHRVVVVRGRIILWDVGCASWESH